ncbi:MAG: tetratricopeptide repeat protein [Planctomycetota bacterium]
MTPHPQLDPCHQMQADLSAMLDGELDDAVVRRAIVHLEICGHCRGFLAGLRGRARLLDGGRVEAERWTRVRQPVDEVPVDADLDSFEGDLFTDSGLWGEELAELGPDTIDRPADHLEWEARMLAESREKLAEIFFQLGRAYVLLALSPELVHVYVREPVPIPEYRQRGRAILDGTGGVRRRAANPTGTGWRGAEDLLQRSLDSVSGNLDKATRLLEEALCLRAPFPAAQIFLAKCRMQRGDHDDARRLYRGVLAQTARSRGPADTVTGVPLRTYAMEHLGVLALVEGEPGLARMFFRWVVRSGAPEQHGSFSSSLLNLAWACVLDERNEECVEALEQVYRSWPGKRAEIGRLLALRRPFQALARGDDAIGARLATTCPEWFGSDPESLRQGQSVRFELVFGEDENGTESPTEARNRPATRPGKLDTRKGPR